MSFNNLSYDTGTYQQDLFQSTEQGKYKLLKEMGQHDDKCFQPYGSGQPHDQVFIGNIIDYQNEILGLNRKYSKDPSQQYPFKQEPVTHTSAEICSSGMGQEQDHSRLDFNREQNRLDLSLQRNQNRNFCLDLQKPSRIPSNTRNGMNTRLYFRDNFQANIKKPLNQDVFAPKESRKPNQEISGNCKCN